MKNSILNLGKVLNTKEQKNIFGGLTDLEYDYDCDAVEGKVPRGCPCTSDSHCIVPLYNSKTKRWYDGQGKCFMGNCLDV
ncbi:hypothetical protein C7448_11066 [Tenacibaculum gallaicum]|uniref:Uncharacterized protein n=1 Tax=Tenacibaculum gallaicum TaxID=561505 RepID=A0A3E0HH09_9FLAO|nr:hypothetical protein [Tenacibaculum gallaicum]REH45038.1 hypothetical protein C7448_11066 [Tenacibaculum gallaicum]